MQILLATTCGCMPSKWHSMYSTTFTWLQCLHSPSSIQSEQHSHCPFQATASAPTQLHLHLVTATQLHYCSSTWKTWCERSQKTHQMETHGVTVKLSNALSFEIWDSCSNLWQSIQNYVYAEGCSSTRAYLPILIWCTVHTAKGLFFSGQEQRIFPFLRSSFTKC